MSLKVYSLAQWEQWEIVVRSFKEYDVYYLPGYVKAFQENGDGEALLVHYESEKLQGIHVVMKRNIMSEPEFEDMGEKNALYDLTTPYGYGGWLIEKKMQDCSEPWEKMLFDEYEKWCQRNGIVSEFVRFHPVLLNYKYGIDFYHVVPIGNTVALDLANPEVIWENFTSKNRNKIRKAKKLGVRIYNGRFPEIFEQFQAVYRSTMDRDHAEEYYYFDTHFFQSILEDLPRNAQIFYAVLDGKVIAASVILAANSHLNYHLSGSWGEYKNYAPINLLLYEAALWGYDNGCRIFHLGGGVGAKEDSLFQFKKSFYRGETYQFHIGKKIYMQEAYDRLVSWRGNRDKKEGFFPLYRA